MRQKLLSSFRLRVVMLVAILCASVCCAWGATYTMSLDSGTKNGTKNVHWTSNNATLTYSNVSWSASFSGGSITNSNSYVQIGSRNSPFTTITLSTSGISGTITEVKVGCGAYNSNATVAVTVGGNAFGGNAQSVGAAPSTSGPCDQNTFTGNASGDIVITITNGNSGRAGYIDYVSVTYTTGSATPTCATPTFSPAAGTYTSAQDVTISTETSGATIYYTIDGTDPTANSSVYSSAIPVSTTTTIKAMAVASGYANSTVASATYTIATPLTNIAALTAKSAGSYTVSLTDALVTYVNGTNAYLEDASGAVILYHCAGDLAVGDKITGTANVTYTVYNDLPEVTAFTLQTGYTKISGNTVTPTEVTIPTLESNYTSYLSRYVKIVGAKVTSAFSNKNSTIEQSGSSIVLRDQNSSATLTTKVGDNVTVTAHPSIFSSTRQIAVYEQSQIVVAKVDPTITFDDGSLRVGQTLDLSTLFTSNSDGEVTYSISAGGSNATLLGSTLTAVAEGSVTVKAEQAATDAYNAGEATATITVNAALPLSSIAVTTAPTTTIYDEGESFDPTGMVVTATYSDNSTEVVTTYTYSPDGALTTSDTEITISYTENEVTKTTTQAITVNEVVDYATLPFSYDGNALTENLVAGLTQEGLTDVYNSSPMIKFDDTGDYLVLKINEAPGILTFDIKGNVFSGGTFKVQTSADGITYTDLASYTSFGSNTQSEEFKNLASTVRYIKWIYTEKSSGNVALGNIALAQPSNDPYVSVSETAIDATAAETEGTITVTYTNFSDIVADVAFFDEDGATSATYNWIEASVNSSNNVEYLIYANTGAARTAYMKVYALDNNLDEVYSELITITQAAYVAPVATSTWASTTLADLTDKNILMIVGDNSNKYAMSNDNGTTSAPGAVAVGVSGTTWTGSVADNLQWNISGNATDGYTFYPNGSTTTWLYCTNNNNGLRVGTGKDNAFTITGDYLYNSGQSRYIGIYSSQDWRSYTSINNNIKDQTFSFYKKVETVKLNDSYGYATYASTSPLDFSDYETAGYSAWAVTSINGENITFSQITGTVPAGTGMLLKGTAGSTVALNVSNAAGTAVTNKLVGITSATSVSVDQYYGLSGKQFVKVNAGTVPAGKALLPASVVNNVSGNARLSFVFEGDDTTTGISTMHNSEFIMHNEVYNLNGQRVNDMKKGGLYIMNGKKVIVK